MLGEDNTSFIPVLVPLILLPKFNNMHKTALASVYCKCNVRYVKFVMPKAVSVSETVSNEKCTLSITSVTALFHMALGFGTEPVCLGDYVHDAHRYSLFSSRG